MCTANRTLSLRALYVFLTQSRHCYLHHCDLHGILFCAKTAPPQVQILGPSAVTRTDVGAASDHVAVDLFDDPATQAAIEFEFVHHSVDLQDMHAA